MHDGKEQYFAIASSADGGRLKDTVDHQAEEKSDVRRTAAQTPYAPKAGMLTFSEREGRS